MSGPQMMPTHPQLPTQDAQEHRQQEQYVRGEHSHRGHTDEQGEGQAIQGALHPCNVEQRGLSRPGRAGCLQTPQTHCSEVTGATQMGTVTASCVTLDEPLTSGASTASSVEWGYHSTYPTGLL